MNAQVTHCSLNLYRQYLINITKFQNYNYRHFQKKSSALDTLTLLEYMPIASHKKQISKIATSQAMISVLSLLLLTAATLFETAGAVGTLDSLTNVKLQVTNGTLNAVSSLALEVESPNPFETGNLFTLTLPSSPGRASFQPAATNFCSMITTAVSITSCTLVDVYTVHMEISVIDGNFPTLLNFKFGQFINPRSSGNIGGVSLTVSGPDQGGGVRASAGSLTDGEITGFVADKLLSASMTPQSNVIGATNTDLEFSLQIKTGQILKPTDRITVYFPRWNPDSGNAALHQIQVATPTCVGVEGLGTSISCSYDETSQLLTIQNPVDSEETGPKNYTVTVQNAFHNPYSGKPRTGYKIATTDENGFDIVSSTGITLTVQVTEWATLATGQIERIDAQSTIGEASTMRINFTSDLPLDANCRIAIAGPMDMPIIRTDLTLMATDQQSRAPSTWAETAKVPNGYSFFYLDECATYSSSISKSIQLQKIRNRGSAKVSGSFLIYLFALDGSVTYPIAKIDSGVTLAADQFTPGTITSFQIAALNGTQVSNQTMFKFTMQPLHSIPTSSVIKITIPSTLTVADGSCSLVYVANAFKNTSQCEIASNVITLTKPFGDAGSYTKGQSSFIFTLNSLFTNSEFAVDVGAFKVQTFEQDGATLYPIDDKTYASGVYKCTSNKLSVTMTSTSSKANDEPVSFTFSITPKAVIPVGGVINITFPKDIQIPKNTNTINCSAKWNETSTPQDFYQTPTRASTSVPLTLLFVGLFSFDPYTDLGKPFSIECRGLKNPRGAGQYNTTQIQVRAQASNLANSTVIEATIEGGQISLLTMPAFRSVSITSSSNVNGATASYTVTFIPDIDLITGDTFTLAFPPEIGMSKTCQISTGVTAISCKITLGLFKASLTFQNGVLAAGSQAKFIITNVRNPNSTQESSEFTIIEAITSDSTGMRKLMNYVGTLLKIKTTQAGVLSASSVSLTQVSKEVNIPTTYSITFKPLNTLPANATYKITLWSRMGLPASDEGFTTCYVMNETSTSNATCTADRVTKTIYVKNVNLERVDYGSSVIIKVGPLTNSPTQKGATSLIVSSYTDNTQDYILDTASTGLIPSFDCDYPCATCMSAVIKSSCLSCASQVDDVPEKFFYGQRCLTACPNGTESNFNGIETFKCSAPTVNFKAYVDSVSSYNAGQENVDYGIKIQPVLGIPQSANLTITFPPEVSLPKATKTVTCVATFSTTTIKSETVTPNTTSPVKLVLSTYFQSSITANTKSIFTVVCKGLWNPRSLAVSSSFNVEIRDGSQPYSVSTGLTVQMRTLPNFSALTMVSDSFLVGGISTFTVSVTPTIELQQNDFISLTFPSDIKIPSAISCNPRNIAVQRVVCSQMTSTRIKAVFEFNSDTLASNTEIQFSIKNIKNPPSTEARTISAIFLHDDTGNEISNFNGVYPKIQPDTPATIIVATLSLDNSAPNAQTGVTITYRAVNPMPQTATFKIGYPATAEFAEGASIVCRTEVTSRVYNNICTLDTVNKVVTIKSPNATNPIWLNSAITAGTDIKIYIGQFTNKAVVADPSANPSFTLTSYSDAAQTYLIDTLQSGLSLLSCAEGQYAYEGQCMDCFSKCKTCSSRNECLSCNENAAEYNYLKNGQCWTKSTYTTGQQVA